MRRFEAVIQSEDSPGTGSLWLRDKKLWYFEGGWKPINGAFDDPENADLREMTKLLIGIKHFIGPDKINVGEVVNSFAEDINSQAPLTPPTNSQYGMIGILEDKLEKDALFPSIWDKILFQLGDLKKVKESNVKMLDYIQKRFSHYNDSYIPVYLQGANIETIPAIYYNAHLYAILGNKFKIYNISTNASNKGILSEMKTVDLSLLPAYIDLELGNTAEVKAYNLEQLQKVSGTQFFVHADFGIGVGSFNSGFGGETTIQTAGGDRVHYLITAEGECKKQEDRFEHSELFFNLGQIDVASLPRTITIRDSVEIAKFRKATNLALEANSNGAYIDDISMSQVSVNTLTKQRLYTSPDIIYVDEQDWNCIRATATTFNDRIEIYIETVQ